MVGGGEAVVSIQGGVTAVVGLVSYWTRGGVEHAEREREHMDS